MPTGGPRDLILLCVALSALLLLFAALDHRPPNDHDDFYTHQSIDDVFAFRDAPLTHKPAVLWQRFAHGTLHAQLAQTGLVATLGTLGVSRFVFRAATLPWVLLLVIGTWLLARELEGPRLALLAAFVVGTLPIVLNYSRKFDIQFHASCMAPLGLWLLVKALRGRGRPGWWAALGAWQGLRFYSHPIQVPDIAVTMALGLAVIVALQVFERRPSRASLRGWVLAAGVCGVVGLWYSGVAGGLIGEPDYSLRRYVNARGSYTAGVWMAEADMFAIGGLVRDLLREVVWVHLMPGAFVLVVLPGLVALPFRLLRSGAALDDHDRAQRWIEWLLLGTVLAQAPPMLLAASNRAYINDWLFVVPTIVILSLIALRWAAAAASAASPRGVRAVGGWTAAVVLNGVLVAAVPLAVSAVGPDPIAHPEFYEQRPLKVFTRSTSGRHLTTHHILTRDDPAHTRLARRARELEPTAEALALGLLDLTWDPARHGGDPCRLGDPRRHSGWSWARPEAANPPDDPRISPWPFAFEGFRELRAVEASSTTPASELPRLVLVRLWLEPTERWWEAQHPCEPVDRIPDGFIEAAEERALDRIGGSVDLRLRDPTGALVGRTIEWSPDRTYLGFGLLVDRESARRLRDKLDEDADVHAPLDRGEARDEAG